MQRKLKSIMKLISRRILDRIIDINPSIPGMLIVNLIYLILGEIIIIALVPNTMRCAIGFLAGVIYSVFATFHMSIGIRKIVYGGAESRATMIVGYLIRLLVMLILFVLLYFLNIGDLLCAVIGMFSMKVAAYLQPFTDKLITKKEGEKVGSSYVNTLVACDSSFMIQSLKEFHIPGIDYTFSINTTHVAMLLVSVFIIIMAIVARVKINKVKPDDTPGMFQNAIEIIVEMLGTMVDGIMGKNANKFVNYISTLFLFIIISNISGLFGLRPPTADYGVTLCLGLITFILVQFNGIKKNKGGHFAALFQPIWFLFPINLIGEFAVPLSLSLRLFGNVMSGTVLMGLIYDLLKPFTIGYPALLHAYFDLFSGCIQAYVFCMLTMVYVNDKIAD